ncbi:Sec-independent protein translocase protein TatB [Malikia granosa]|uniref:Sec-independent protein translocase protein TatB n=1 Tax=Malikia granosa TaxID=263067 RepID=A0A2S9K955_9BURK|nr:Sec-independent protein translocase protein TatB [Malikia granosa]PRD66944.1 twin-arginine translocase subunit TatB [Malikia granosa]
MIDLGISKLALIGAVALVVIGPEKLPRVARTVGTLLGKAQRYVADVKAEVNRSMELDELKKMKDSMTSAAQEVQSSMREVGSEFERSVSGGTDTVQTDVPAYEPAPPVYRHPKKNFRLKQKAVPQWYKARQGLRSKAQSGAARVARFRPKSRFQ